MGSRSRDAATVQRVVGEEISPNLARIVVPLQKNLHYPIEKAYNAANVDVCRRAEAQLDKMWNVVDAHFDKHVNTTIQAILLKHGVSPREIQRTPEWVPPILRSPQTPQAGETLQDGFSRLVVEEDKPGRLRDTGHPPPKIKTRGNAQSADSTNGHGAANEQQQAYEPPTFTLARRAWKVFSTMFHMSSEKDHVGEINWADFLHAMASIGFAGEKLHGSAWEFTPSKLDVENSIQVHEPHPSGKISFGMARSLGKRFFRTYGLTGESFKLA